MGGGESRMHFRLEDNTERVVLPPVGSKPRRSTYLVLLSDGPAATKETDLCRSHHMLLYDQKGWSTDTQLIGWRYHLRADPATRDLVDFEILQTKPS